MCFTSLGGAIARSFDKGLSAFWWLSCFKSLTRRMEMRSRNVDFSLQNLKNT